MKVPGSGTWPGGVLQPASFPFLPPVLAPVEGSPFFFFPGVQLGRGGGYNVKAPPLPTMRLYSGGVIASTGRFVRVREDSKFVGYGMTVAVPGSSWIGVSRRAMAGSLGETSLRAVSDTSLPQRVRSVILPSVMTFSPRRSRTRLVVQ